MAHTKVTKTYSQNTGVANTFSYSGSFDVFKGTEVVVELDNVELTYTASTINESASPREFTVDTPNKTVHIGGANLSSGTIIIRPNTDMGSPTPRATYSPGSSITAEDLNNNQKQIMRKCMEYDENLLSTTGGTMTGHLAIGEDQTISFEGATDNAYETTITVVDPTADRTITIPNVTGTVITTGDTATVTATMMAADSVDSSELVDGSIDASHISSNAVTTAKITADAVTGAKIADDAIDSEHYVDGSIDTAHIGAGQVTHVKLAADAVDGDNIADDSVNSEHYVDGSIDTAHLAADVVTGAKIADDSIDSEHYVDGSIDAAHIASNAVTTAKINADAITSAKIADDAVTNDHLAVDSVASPQIRDNNVTTAKILDANVTRAKLQADCINATKIEDDAVDTEHIADDAVEADQLAANAVVNASIASGAAIAHSKLAAVADTQILVGNGSNVPTAVAVSGDVTIANTGAVTIANNAVEIGMIGCEQTTISDSDSHIPTSGAVVDYVAAQINPIGGLEVIADDESFPNTLPAAGVVISITDAAGLQINSSGVSTNGDTLDNSTVTINGFPSALRGGVGNNADPYVLGSGAGLMVQSTGSSQTYNYHKALLKESDFVQLSDDINDFNSKYRIASSAPGSDNDEGDLYFNTSTNKMNVYDGSAWGEVTSTGDYKLLTIKDHDQAVGGSGPTFNGSNEEFDLFDGSSDASINSVGQLLVVLNGVLQKPNSGTFSGSEEGFYLNDTHGIKFCDPPPSGSTLYVTQIGTATTVNVPADGSVTAAKIGAGAVIAAKIGTGAVETAKLAADAVDGTKLADNACDSEHYTDGSIDHVHLAGDAVDGDNIADDSIDSEHYVNGSIDHAHLANDCVDSDNIADNQVGLAAMAGIARGKIIYGDASGNPAYLALGSNGQVLKSDGTDIAWAADAGGAALSNDANNRVTTADGSGGINGEANLTFDGTHLTIADGDLVIGTHGHGIDFSAANHTSASGASMTAELLDDYEEGTWEPSLITGVTSYNSRVGYYTKIGRLVTANGYINVTTDSSSNGDYARVYGLPFTSDNDASMHGVAIGWWYGLPENVPFAYLGSNATYITLLGENGSGSRDHVTHNDIWQSRSSARIQFTVSYVTTS